MLADQTRVVTIRKGVVKGRGTKGKKSKKTKGER